jgi:hypothetical protein
MEIKIIKLNYFKNRIKKLFFWWIENSNFIFIILFSALSAYGAFLMYQGLYNSNWSNDQKNVYISSQQKNVQFKEDFFVEIISEINRRRSEYEKEVSFGSNIFIVDQVASEEQGGI